jgi:hypothetical protein
MDKCRGRVRRPVRVRHLPADIPVEERPFKGRVWVVAMALQGQWSDFCCDLGVPFAT